MAIRSYLVRFSADVPITINDEDVQEGDVWGHVMAKSQDFLDSWDMNELKFSLSIVNHIEESTNQ